MMNRVHAAVCAAIVALAVTAVGPTGRILQAQGFADQKLDPALAAQLGRVAAAAPLEVVIVFADRAGAASVRGLASRFFEMRALPMAGAVLTAEQIRTVAQWPEIHSITLNVPLKYFLAESVPLVQADRVWTTYGQTGGNTTVAVIDSGIDATHPDLLAGTSVIQNVKVLPFELSLENQAITDTSSGHGTHVAGTIGGRGVASSGHYRGVAPDVKLVGLGAGEGLSILTATQAYDWVLENHAEYNIRVVSNSWGSTGGEISLRNPIVMATLEAYNRGILSVFAAGNDGGYDLMNPYSLAPWVLSVAAGRKDRTLADFSSRGKDGDYFKHPDITAPGVNIYAARTKTVGITAADPLPNPVNPLWTATYTVMSGTSMATPHVSGAAALLFSSNPQLSPDQVMDLLISTVTPMAGYALHEAGHGYMNVLAAYEASRAMSGNLQAFLAGERQHTEQEVYGFDPDEPVLYDEYLFTGVTAAGAAGVGVTATGGTGAVGSIDHPFTVADGTLYVEIRLIWTPQLEDAYDVEVLDPQGRVVVSSGNGLEEGEGALFVPDAPGTYVLRLHPFASVLSQYEARVKVAYGTPPANWPPSTVPSHAVYLGVDGIYKEHLAAGIASEYFRSGDAGFAVFKVATADGVALPGHAANLRAVYSDRTGKIVFIDSRIFDRGDGEYSTSFDASTAGWTPGSVTLSFVWTGEGSLRAVPTGFALNHLDASLRTSTAAFAPGDRIAFSGVVAQTNTAATGVVKVPPAGGALVTVRLLDSAGNRLASTEARTDAEGRYAGSVVAPARARGPAALVAEATYDDATILLGTKTWVGTAFAGVRFPGNMPPSVALGATPQSNRNANRTYVAIDASVRDADGAADIASISLVMTDGSGKAVGRWSKGDFTAHDDGSWRFGRVVRAAGKAPWTLTLTARDSAGQTATKTQTVN